MMENAAVHNYSLLKNLFHTLYLLCIGLGLPISMSCTEGIKPTALSESTKFNVIQG